MSQANVAIEDHKGVDRKYALRRLPAGLAVARLELTSEAGKVYEVRLERGGSWLCTCPSYKYRRRQNRLVCKHISEARRAHELVTALTGPEVAR